MAKSKKTVIICEGCGKGIRNIKGGWKKHLNFSPSCVGSNQKKPSLSEAYKEALKEVKAKKGMTGA